MPDPDQTSGAPAGHPAKHEKPEGLLAAPPEQRQLKPPDVVTFKNVSKSFGEGAEAKLALQDINFTIEDLPVRG